MKNSLLGTAGLTFAGSKILGLTAIGPAKAALFAKMMSLGYLAKYPLLSKIQSFYMTPIFCADPAMISQIVLLSYGSYRAYKHVEDKADEERVRKRDIVWRYTQIGLNGTASLLEGSASWLRYIQAKG